MCDYACYDVLWQSNVRDTRSIFIHTPPHTEAWAQMSVHTCTDRHINTHMLSVCHDSDTRVPKNPASQTKTPTGQQLFLLEREREVEEEREREWWSQIQILIIPVLLHYLTVQCEEVRWKQWGIQKGAFNESLPHYCFILSHLFMVMIFAEGWKKNAPIRFNLDRCKWLI